MILLVDADSMIFASCYRTNRQPDEDPFYQDIEEAKAKFDQTYFKILNEIEEKYRVDDVLTFNGSTGNFRKHLTRKYKANRTNQPKPPLLGQLHYYVTEAYDGINGSGVETDDLVATYWYKITKDAGRDSAMIVSIDKDYMQFPALIYNYGFKHRCVYDVSEEEARYNFYEQMIAGDTADNVNYFLGKGKAFARKYYEGCETDYQYRKRLFKLFKEKYKSKAREKYIECYSLLKLKIL